MQVRLAGYNLETNLIEKLGETLAATPEVISAAYARISRSSKTISELRAEARSEISKARASNHNIIFEMGHSSVAEHAVFNFDLIGISRYLAEFIQRSRLASFTEKSQRYVTLKSLYVIPPEIVRSPLENDFKAFIDDAFLLYSELFSDLLVIKATEQDWASRRDLEGAAKEDARYVLPLCTQTQMGMTINARSLELLLRRLAAVDLQEAAQLRDLLYQSVSSVSPSLIRYTATDVFSYHKISSSLHNDTESYDFNETTLLDYPRNADDRVLAGVLFEQRGGNYTSLLEQLKTASKKEKRAMWDDLFTGIKPWHKLPRAFELVDFTFELTMSSSCYAQFKRHRLCTILKSPYTVSDGVVIPTSLANPQHITAITALLARAQSLADELYTCSPLLYPYALTNAHRIRVIAKLNLREIYHFVRLRSDAHAQWEIRAVSQDIATIVRLHCPLAAKWLMGKSEMP